MKKTLFKSLLLGFAALTALNASAENKLIIEDFALAPGETKEIPVYIQNDQVFNSFQFEIAPIQGLSFDYACEPTDAELIQVSVDDHWPHKSNGNVISVPPQDNTLEDGTYRVVLTHMTTYSNSNKYIVPFGIGEGIICVLGVTADENFTGGKIVCTYAKGDYSDPAKPEWVGQFEISNQEVCNITAPAAAGTPLKEIVETGVDGTEYTVKEDLAIVAKSDVGYLFVSDGAGNWMKVKADETVYTTMKDYTSIKGGTLIGVLSDANCNQTLTITKAAEQGGNVTASAVAWDLAQSDPTSAQYKFAPKVNEVILLTGFWFANENAFRGYSDQSGQSATANFDWCDTEPTMQNGVLYKDIQSVAQLKKAWDAATTGAPAKVAADDPLSFQNYVVYPLAISESQVITGVDNLNASKDVVSVQYVNAAGMVSTTPFKGVNMVVTRYADGSQVTTKVVK